jgi:hypothetical protein
MLGRNRVAVWVDLGIAQNRRHAILEALRDEVLEPLGLFVHLVPGILQNVVEEELQQAVVPHQFPRPPLARGGEPDAAVLLVLDHRGTLRRQALQHSGHRRGADAQPLREGVRRDTRIFSPA